MDRIKTVLDTLFGSNIVFDGKGRTYAKAPVWLVVLCALLSVRLALITAVLMVAFGMRAQIVRR